eukprot:TRINITY_DN8345_c0_g1_i1.p1 TRINITY_DN8345_c0_g1~~TRINITY_DN8345_c0_g1_i1.p1  ORF type:complete len:124 (+),score=49.98 TRINITY_DN8345_c0_g1_i1:216-587(+)
MSSGFDSDKNKKDPVVDSDCMSVSPFVPGKAPPQLSELVGRLRAKISSLEQEKEVKSSIDTADTKKIVEWKRTNDILNKQLIAATVELEKINSEKIYLNNSLSKKKKYRLRGRSSETAKAHRG